MPFETGPPPLPDTRDALDRKCLAYLAVRFGPVLSRFFLRFDPFLHYSLPRLIYIQTNALSGNNNPFIRVLFTET